MQQETLFFIPWVLKMFPDTIYSMVFISECVCKLSVSGDNHSCHLLNLILEICNFFCNENSQLPWKYKNRISCLLSCWNISNWSIVQCAVHIWWCVVFCRDVRGMRWWFAGASLLLVWWLAWLPWQSCWWTYVWVTSQFLHAHLTVCHDTREILSDELYSVESKQESSKKKVMLS